MNTSQEQEALSLERIAQEARQETEDKFRLFVDAVKDYSILMLGPTGEITGWNAGGEHLLGFKSEEVMDKSITILYPHDPAAAQHTLEEARETGRAVTEGWRFRHDGSQFWARTVTTAVFLPDRTLHGFSEVTQDLTERRNHEANLENLNLSLERLVRVRTMELEAANKELESFSYSVSHDLQAPLRSIDGFAKILLEDHADKLDEAALRNLEVISKSALRMRQLIEDLLDFSKLTRQPLKTRTLDLSTLAGEVIEELRLEHPDRTVNVDILPMPVAKCDEVLLRQVFLNLLSNAIKFAKTDLPVTIEIGGHTGEFEHCYYVRDSGVGFDSRYAHKLFAPFQRLHSIRVYAGNGIGLALVQRIIRRHGGRVWAESELSKGATFSFTLPIEEQK